VLAIIFALVLDFLLLPALLLLGQRKRAPTKAKVGELPAPSPAY